MPSKAKTKLANFAQRAGGRNGSRPPSDELTSTSFEDDRYRNRTPSPESSYDHHMAYSQQPAMQEVQYTDDLLIPPNLPFSEVTGGQYQDNGTPSNGGSRNTSFTDLTELRSNSKSNRPPSLSINYVPTKFSKLHTQGDWAHRRAKQGGGRDAFSPGAARMGEPGTVDDDEGLVFELGKGGLKPKRKHKLRWNRFKWILFLANWVLIIYAMATLICCILVWINVFYQSDVVRVGNRTELILSTIAACLSVFTALLGFSGLFLNSRPFLAVYTVLLWVCLAFIVAPGYITYKRHTFNLEGKINQQWSQSLGTVGRLRIQDALRCCGYFSPSSEATVSPLCYPRSVEDGCKNKYLKLERNVTRTWYTVSFSLVPAHIFIILAGLLCSNHVTYRFGKGLTPKRYRLDLDSMAIIMNDYASQIANQYGPGVAQDALERSSLHLNSPAGSRRGSFAGESSSLGHGLTNPVSRHHTNSPSLRNQNQYESPFDDGSDSVHGSEQGHRAGGSSLGHHAVTAQYDNNGGYNVVQQGPQYNSYSNQQHGY